MSNFSKAYYSVVSGEWNQYRTIYSELTIDELVQMNTKWDSLFMKQNCANKEVWKEMFAAIEFDNPLWVIELGCHEGGLANYIMQEDKISRWLGYDINHKAIDRAFEKRKDNIYFTPMKLGRWFYELPLQPVDVFVCSHTLEHFSDAQAIAIIDHVKHIEFLLFEVPFEVPSGNWNNYKGTHVLRGSGEDMNNKLDQTHEKIWQKIENLNLNKGDYVGRDHKKVLHHEIWNCVWRKR
ncbi:MAG: class I SAM-dependent methyltransferase [Candidatus Hodarchaeales archaeon]|jgi:hypothetical protein